MCLATMFHIGPAKVGQSAGINRLHDEHAEALACFRPATSLDAISCGTDTVCTESALDETRVISWGGEVCAAAHWSMRAASACAGLETPDATISWLSVSRSFERAGLGRRLVADIAARARARGATRLTVVAPIDAMPFLQRLGFRPTRLTEVRLPARTPLADRALGTTMVLALQGGGQCKSL